MTHDLGPTARALLDAARDGLAPDAAALARVRAKVAASTAATATGTALAVKLALVGVAAVIATGVALRAPVTRALAAPQLELATPPTVPPLAPRVVVHVRETAPAAAPAPRARVALRTPVVAPSPQGLAGEAVPATAVSPRAAGAPSRDRPRSIVRVDDRRPSTSSPRAPRVDLAREVELVDQAMASLRRRDPHTALAAVRTHAAETAGRGQLAEDAAAIEIEALCRLRDPRTAAKLATFDARWPSSAQRSRLTTTCP